MRRNHPEPGNDRRGYRGLSLLCQLTKFLIEEFVFVLLAPPEHEGTGGSREQRKNAEQLFHGTDLLFLGAQPR